MFIYELHKRCYKTFLILPPAPHFITLTIWLVAITDKMQLSNGILLFHSTLIVQHVSSVMSLIIRNINCICSSYGTTRSPQAYVNQNLQIQLRLLMMSDITLETCWTINVLWNNKIPLLSCIFLVIATRQGKGFPSLVLSRADFIYCLSVCKPTKGFTRYTIPIYEVQNRALDAIFSFVPPVCWKENWSFRRGLESGYASNWLTDSLRN